MENGKKASPQININHKKMLSITPDFETHFAVPAKLIESRSCSPRECSHKKYFLEYSLMAEYDMLSKQKLPGVYVIPSAKSPMYWNGILFVRQGIYQGGVFRFSLFIPENYPDGECPKFVFDPPIYHPLVDIETGELDVKRSFMKWRRGVNYIWQVLLYARRIFYKIDSTSPLNHEAAVLYEKDEELFKDKVARCLREQIKHLYDMPQSDDPHTIRFSPWDPAIHEEVRKKLLNLKVNAEGT